MFKEPLVYLTNKMTQKLKNHNKQKTSNQRNNSY